MLLMITAFIITGYFIERPSFIFFIITAGISFACFLLLLKDESFSLKQLVYFAIVCRAVFIFSIPVLSDDYFRFLWDGQLTNMGINPFLALPAELIQQQDPGNSDMMPFLFAHMNSPNYFSVYPTVMQGCFSVATWLFPHSVKSPIIILHFIILLAELGSIYFGLKILKILKLPAKNILWYALNPLIIIELTGNLHFEALMIFFCAASFYFFMKNKMVAAGIFLSLAIATKLLPLVFIPFYLKYVEGKSQRLFLASIFISCAILFIPFLNPAFINHFLQSIGLYFYSFEFNGSIYKVLKWMGYLLTGKNIMAFSAALLPLVTLIIIYKIYRLRNKNFNKLFFQSLLFSLTTYFALSPIIHPWYITSLVFINVFLNYKFIYLWSASILLSYFAYRQIPYAESTLISMLQYVPVIILMIFELKKSSPIAG